MKQINPMNNTISHSHESICFNTYNISKFGKNRNTYEGEREKKKMKWCFCSASIWWWTSICGWHSLGSCSCSLIRPLLSEWSLKSNSVSDYYDYTWRDFWGRWSSCSIGCVIRRICRRPSWRTNRRSSRSCWSISSCFPQYQIQVSLFRMK